MSSFAERFKKLREIMGWTQEDAARELGLARSTIAGYEAKNKVPRRDTLKSIADRFKVSVDYLLGLIDEDYSERLLVEKDAFYSFDETVDMYKLYLIKSFEIILNQISDSEIIHKGIVDDVLKTVEIFNGSVYKGIFESTAELRAIFYSMEHNQTEILDGLYQLLFSKSNPNFVKINPFYEKTFREELKLNSLSDHYVELSNKINSEQDLIVAFNPFHDYFTCFNLIASCEIDDFNRYKNNVRYALEALYENKILRMKLLKDIHSELDKIRERGSIVKTNKVLRSNFALINKQEKIHISNDEADYLLTSLDLYRKQKEKWNNSPLT